MSLLDCLLPWFALVLDFVRKPEGSAAALAQTLETELAHARIQAQRAGQAPAQIDLALFAACAWADEQLQHAAWDGAAQWPLYLLQRKLFHLSDSGDEFFARLQNLRSDQDAAREVFAVCLALRFGGRYAHAGQIGGLAKLRESNLAQVLGSSPADLLRRRLFPGAYPAPPSDTGRRFVYRHRWLLTLCALGAGLLLAEYALLWWMLHETARRILHGAPT